MMGARIRTLPVCKAIGLRHRAANRNPIPPAMSAERDRQLAAAALRLYAAFARIEQHRP